MVKHTQSKCVLVLGWSAHGLKRIDILKHSLPLRFRRGKKKIHSQRLKLDLLSWGRRRQRTEGVLKNENEDNQYWASESELSSHQNQTCQAAVLWEVWTDWRSVWEETPVKTAPLNIFHSPIQNMNMKNTSISISCCDAALFFSSDNLKCRGLKISRNFGSI